MTARHALWALIASSTLLHLAWAACLGPGNDEAYHYLFTVHRDWSYYDHPPMMALVEQVGLTLAGGQVSALSLRLGFIGLFAGSTFLMARLTSRFFGARAGVIAAFVLNATAYYGAAASTFALPDGPLVFFWLLTLDRMAVALASPGRLSPWIGVGLAWAGALLSKYQAVFLPAGAFLYLVLEPSARSWLRKPGPYLALVLGLVGFSPVIGWNAANGWASFAFQGGRAVEGLRFRPDALAWFVVGQALYLLPWVWVFLVGVLVRGGRRLLDGASPPERFLLCQAIPPLAVFLVISIGRPVLPHWTLVAFLSVVPMLGRDWSALWGERSARLRRRLVILAVVPVVVVSGFAVQARWGVVPGIASNDPTIDTYGWNQVSLEIERRGLMNQPGTFLFTSKWYHSGHLAFATANRVPVLCYNPRRAHGFANWSRPDQWVGHDGLLVVVNDTTTEPDMFDRWFERIDYLGNFEVVRSGRPVRRIRFYRCVRQTHPFPFDGSHSEHPGDDLAANKEVDDGTKTQ
ncbi:MAG: glycosyltransferase family 39 protein [Isosphaeraceae bacterium]